MQHIIPQINNPHYRYCMTILQAISLLAPVMGAEITCQKLLPVIINFSKDMVPNIKFNVAKVLQSLISILDQSVVEKTVRPCLGELSEDSDVDVRYYANQALQVSTLLSKRSPYYAIEYAKVYWMYVWHQAMCKRRGR
ncbi:protein phosphatase PP2A regulatory subunit A-like isoform X4 [Panicum virgatum]|uniref:protein phosphatase PP2A regulatory subunit A-like isoform X4 n=1 Tax=Panicum virgatum TaxID=38727 RepID=UPI0019D4F53E|nr:protein phosphatase PP2A regulatory subunit A-like isoform X4 [Panicum virgatum]XP_039807783.1 protein phosphatase PP2A regulatory subunit A-like isoform X4 [Panicum virgatum]XP_039807784.1 protein phosphatase PP2A regulatory subunit A-like isoform X4 [Panicum virgatum]